MPLHVSNPTCHVFTYKSGALSALGHDLELELRRIRVDHADDQSFVVTLDPASVSLVGRVDGGKTSPMSAHDAKVIEQAAKDDVLRISKFPEIRIEGKLDEAHTSFRGTLTLAGRKRDLTLDVAKRGDELSAEVTLVPSQFGIEPYRAMLGALKLRDEVRVVVRARIDS